jgi:hypothetical protein
MEKVSVKLKKDYTVYGVERKAGEVITGVYEHVAKRKPEIYEIINETEGQANAEEPNLPETDEDENE